MTSGVPQGLALGPILFSISRGIECTLSKFRYSTKVSAAVDTSEGRGAIQRELDMLGRWADANLMKFDTAKCKVLQLSHSNPIQTYRLGREVIKSRPVEKGFRSELDEKLKVRHQRVLAARKANPVLGCTKRGVTSRTTKVILFLYSALGRPHLECSIVLVPPIGRTFLLE